MTQPVHTLHNFYNAGLHRRKDAIRVLRKITDLSQEQLQNWFERQRQNDIEMRNRIPSENMPRAFIPATSGAGKWTAQKRRILKACFDSGFGVAKYFGLIVAITGLHKAQVSNWVRQRRYHLRKIGQFPPVPNKEDKYEDRDKENQNDSQKALRSLVFEALKENRKRKITSSYQPCKRPRLQRCVNVKLDSTEHWGVKINYHLSELIVTRVDLGFQAHEKGIRVGWRVEKINNVEISPKNLTKIGEFLQYRQNCDFVFKVV